MLVSARENRRSEGAPAKGCRPRREAGQERVRRPREGAQTERSQAKKGARKTRSLRETRKPKGEASAGRGEA